MGETPGKMYALAAVLTLLAIVAVLLRFYARRVKKISPEFHDYMILPALVLNSKFISVSCDPVHPLITFHHRSSQSVKLFACLSVHDS